MNGKNISVFLYGGIAICITVMLILFSGTLSDSDDRIDGPPVTDELFVPESVVKLTEENTNLRATIQQYSNDIVALENEVKVKDEKIAKSDETINVFNKLSEATYLISQKKKDEAREILSVLDINTLDENARILYEKISKEID